jgi:DnaK suppressor protein
MLSPEDKQKIRAEIIRKLETIKNSIKNLREQSKPVSPDNAIGRITRMDAIQQKSIAEATLGKAEGDQTKLEAALSQVDHPEFGMCLRCHQPIPLGRILAVPETRICVSCAEARIKK